MKIFQKLINIKSAVLVLATLGLVSFLMFVHGAIWNGSQTSQIKDSLSLLTGAISLISNTLALWLSYSLVRKILDVNQSLLIQIMLGMSALLTISLVSLFLVFLVSSSSSISTSVPDSVTFSVVIVIGSLAFLQLMFLLRNVFLLLRTGRKVTNNSEWKLVVTMLLLAITTSMILISPVVEFATCLNAHQCGISLPAGAL